MLTLTLDTDDIKKDTIVLKNAEGKDIRQVKLTSVNRVKTLALEGISPEDIIRILTIDLDTVLIILEDTLTTEQVEQLGIPRLIKENEEYLKFKSGLDKIDANNDDEVASYYGNYLKEENTTIIPKPLTYLDISDYKRITKKTILENTRGMLGSLRNKLISNLLIEANNGLIPRRDAVSILRVIGTNEQDDNKTLANMSSIKQVNNDNSNNFQIVFDSKKFNGDSSNLTITEEGEVVGLNGEVTNNITRNDLLNMLNRLD